MTQNLHLLITYSDSNRRLQLADSFLGKHLVELCYVTLGKFIDETNYIGFSILGNGKAHLDELSHRCFTLRCHTWQRKLAELWQM